MAIGLHAIGERQAYQQSRSRERNSIGLKMQTGEHRILKCFVSRAGDGTDVERIADSAVVAWRAIDTALSPIIGPLGIATLYGRSVYLTRVVHPCLADVHESLMTPNDYAVLRAVLIHQTSEVAWAASAALLQTFCDQLGTLIGESLTERLLRATWESPSSGPAVQDTLP